LSFDDEGKTAIELPSRRRKNYYNFYTWIQGFGGFVEFYNFFSGKY
jgi:hypothetical protein